MIIEIDVPIKFEEITHEEAEAIAAIETGLATSAVVLVFGCKHWFYRCNGDSLSATCPRCFLSK